MSNSLDLDPDLGTDCLQKLSAYDTSRQRVQEYKNMKKNIASHRKSNTELRALNGFGKTAKIRTPHIQISR